MTLSTEIAAARPEEQREVLWKLFSTLYPTVPEDDDEEDFENDHRDYWVRRHRFAAMLDCGAFLSAAEMLVPNGWGYKVRRWAGGGAAAGIYPPESADDWHNAATPALALAAAIAKSLEEG